MRIPALLSFAVLSHAVSCQYWRACGRGPIGPTEVQALYGDSISDRLLAGGTFLRIMNQEDTVLGVGQAAWNGERWDSLAHRIQQVSGLFSTQQTYWFLRFQGDLYACGGFGFEVAPEVYNRSFARLNEQTQRWEALECLNPAGILLTLVPKEPQGTLYATGYADDLCGHPSANVFRYDGEAFHIWEPFTQIPVTSDNDNYVGTVFDFQGKTYMTGHFRDPLSAGYCSFMRFNGTTWEYVPGWNTLEPIKDISIRNDTLYVVGAFHLSNGSPGNLATFFDGTTWNDMGGGLSHPPAPASGAALDLEWFHGELYACGLFHDAAGVTVDGIAKWNGQQWCGLPGDFQGASSNISTLLDMATWRDSLYVCGTFNTVDDEPIRRVAQWIGGDATTNCSPPVGVGEHQERANLELATSDNGLSWTIQFPSAGPWMLNVFDATGRLLDTRRSNGSTILIELSDHTSGIYLIRATSATGEYRAAKAQRP